MGGALSGEQISQIPLNRSKQMKYFVPASIALAFIVVVGCIQRSSFEVVENFSANDTSTTGNDSTHTGTVFITDRTGKAWDITHAVEVYGMEPRGFQFGLGPFAIRPLNNPEFYLPGDPQYPNPAFDFLIIGTRISGDARAYPIDALSYYEIVNEQFGPTHVSVAY